MGSKAFSYKEILPYTLDDPGAVLPKETPDFHATRTVLYAYFSFLTLFWVFPYALLTIRSKFWMTR